MGYGYFTKQKNLPRMKAYPTSAGVIGYKASGGELRVANGENHHNVPCRGRKKGFNLHHWP